MVFERIIFAFLCGCSVANPFLTCVTFICLQKFSDARDANSTTLSKTLLRSLRHFRPSERRRTDLLRTLRAAASRPGKRGHRHLPRGEILQAPRHGAGAADFQRRNSARPCRQHGHRPHALFHHRLVAIAQRPAAHRGLRARPDRHRAQRQSDQRRAVARRTGKSRLDFPDHGGQRNHFAPAGAAGFERRGKSSCPTRCAKSKARIRSPS